MCVGIYWIVNIHQKTHLISKTSFICISLAILFVQLQNINFAPVFQINIGILFLHLIVLLWKKDVGNAKIVAFIFLLPTLFTILDMLLTGKISMSIYARNTWDAAYIAAGIWLINKSNTRGFLKYAPKLIYVGLLIYTFLLIQLPIGSWMIIKPLVIFDWIFNFSTVVFTSHICIYTAAAFFLAVYFCVKFPWKLKIVALPIFISLSLFILYTSWRPVWLGIIVGLIVAAFFCYKQHKKIIFGGLVLLQVVLLLTNLAHYRDRVSGLVTQSGSEERVVIWQDAWKMQLNSQFEKWLTGHGLMSFEQDFKYYSRFYLHPELIPIPPVPPRHHWVFSQTINDYLIRFRIYSGYLKEQVASKYFSGPISFKSPHNVVLDLLYSTGILGVMLIGCFYLLLMRYLIKLSQIDVKMRLMACITLSALISNLIVNGLNFPFFLHFNLMPLAYICGTTLCMHESCQGIKQE